MDECDNGAGLMRLVQQVLSLAATPQPNNTRSGIDA